MFIILVRILLVVFSYMAMIFVAPYFGLMYEYFFPNAVGGTWIGAPSAWLWLIGYPLGLIFLLTFLMHFQGRRHVWWWNIIALAPAILFEVVLDPFHIYFPIILGVIAWRLGTLANKALWKRAPGVMAKIG